MALIEVPARTTTTVSAGSESDVLIANNGVGSVRLNTTDPSDDGYLVLLHSGETLALAAGTAPAAAEWRAWSQQGTQLSVTVF